LITGAATREVLYVAATRGRAANHIYTDLDSVERDPEAADLSDTDDGNGVRDARDALAGIIARSASATAAHTLIAGPPPIVVTPAWPQAADLFSVPDRRAAPQVHASRSV
jgi:hypothetical protein